MSDRTLVLLRHASAESAIGGQDDRERSLTDAAGRKRLTTFPPYIANLGFRPDERISHVTTIYCGGDPDLSGIELAEAEGAE